MKNGVQQQNSPIQLYSQLAIASWTILYYFFAINWSQWTKKSLIGPPDHSYIERCRNLSSEHLSLVYCTNLISLKVASYMYIILAI